MIQHEHLCFTVYGAQMFRVVSVLLSVWKRKSVLVEMNGRCKNILLSSQHRGTNMTRIELFFVSASVLTTFLPDASAFSLSCLTIGKKQRCGQS
jgi:hypothetical protein